MSPVATDVGVRLLADHSIIDTAPFFLPAFLVVGVLVAIVVRDRRRPRDEESDDGVDEPTTHGDGEGDRAA
jgi:hypothetical protein